jgi:hypothetical protein
VPFEPAYQANHNRFDAAVARVNRLASLVGRLQPDDAVFLMEPFHSGTFILDNGNRKLAVFRNTGSSADYVVAVVNVFFHHAVAYNFEGEDIVTVPKT